MPALVFIAGGLLIPLVRTIIQSLENKDSSEFVGIDNYQTVITSPTFFTAENWDWSNIFGSRLFWIAAVATVIGLVIGLVNGRVVRRPFEATPGSVIVLLIAFFFAACLVLGTLRGSIVNNLWWVIVVTILSTAFGLAVAVLSDRAKGENVAKSLIFLPLAISFVGAGVIWTLIYQTRNVSKPQTGVLNALWIGLGELSNSGWQKWLVVGRGAGDRRRARLRRLERATRRELQPGGGRRRHRRAVGRLDRDLPVPRPRRLRRDRRRRRGEDDLQRGRRPALQQHVADGGADLDPDRLRHGDLLVGDQGRPHRVRRSGPHRRGDRVADVLAHHAARRSCRPSASS